MIAAKEKDCTPEPVRGKSDTYPSQVRRVPVDRRFGTKRFIGVTALIGTECSGIRARSRSLITMALAIYCILGFSAYPVASAGQPSPRRILVLDQFPASSLFAATLLSGFDSTLNKSSPLNTYLYTEFLDVAQFRGRKFENALLNYFREKYLDRPIDAVLASGTGTVDLAVHLRDQLWPNVPIVFAAVDEERMSNWRLPPNVTGTTMRLNLRDSLDVARALVPNLKRIALVGDPPERQFIRTNVRAQLAQISAEVDLVDLTESTMDEVKKTLSSLPDDAAIVYIGLTAGGSGQLYTTHDAFVAIASFANRPIVVQTDAHLGFGATGGIVEDAFEIGNRTARLVSRVLAGESASSIPIAAGSDLRRIFDWRQLQRWNISESGLPPGSEVRYREAGFWAQYRTQAQLFLAALLIQAGLITWLIYEHRHRHAAEVMARQTMADLAHMNRVATAGELSASIAHEVNQPLTGMVTRANAALRWLAAQPPDIDSARAAMHQIVNTGHRAGEIITTIRSMFKKETHDKKPVYINALINIVLQIMRIDLNKYGIAVCCELDEHLPAVPGVAVQLQQVILNLVLNAVESMHLAQSAVRVLTIKSERSETERVHVSIEDTGGGIDPSNLNRVFKPLFTTKSRGMGMGLSICNSIVMGHNGQIWVTASNSGGSIFHFELPTRDEEG